MAQAFGPERRSRKDSQRHHSSGSGWFGRRREVPALPDSYQFSLNVLAPPKPSAIQVPVCGEINLHFAPVFSFRTSAPVSSLSIQSSEVT